MEYVDGKLVVVGGYDADGTTSQVLQMYRQIDEQIDRQIDRYSNEHIDV